MVTREEYTRQYYQDYYRRKGADRNDLRANPGVLLQTLANEASVVRAARAIAHDPRAAKVLDVGCGDGSNLYQLLRLEYDPNNITGIDILPDRIAAARRIYPQVGWVQGDASRMDFPDGTFDLVFESTMFANVPDETLSQAIAREMVRVCKPGAYLLLVDWRTPNPRDPNYRALTKKRLRRLFAIGRDTELLGMYRGALVPPVGRFLSRRLPSVYFLVAALCPLLVGQVAYLLMRRSEQAGSAGNEAGGEGSERCNGQGQQTLRDDCR